MHKVKINVVIKVDKIDVAKIRFFGIFFLELPGIPDVALIKISLKNTDQVSENKIAVTAIKLATKALTANLP